MAPPQQTPARKRSAVYSVNDVTNDATRETTESRNTVQMTVGRRPYRSERFPNTRAPSSTPTKHTTLPQLNGHLKIVFLPPATKLWQGDVFTGVCLSTGGRAWQSGVGGRGSLHGGGHVWWRVCVAEGHAWHASPQQILRDTVNERAVRILLECNLVVQNFPPY